MQFCKVVLPFAAAGLMAASPALADDILIDLTGWEAFAGFGDASNSSTTVNIGPGSSITGAAWIDLDFTPQGASWQSDLFISLNDSDLLAFWDSTVSDVDGGGSYTGSGSFPGPNAIGGPFSVLDDGLLYVEVWDAFDDEAGSDASISGGTLRVSFTVPEPASAGLLGLGGLLLLHRRR